jgi:hypothetical protein
MDLVGLLSNHETSALFQSLTDRSWRQVRRRTRSAGGVAPDGRRKFGAVRDAIVNVLREAEGELRVCEIHARVEAHIGGPVSRGSVKAYMRIGCTRKAPLFEYLGGGRYRLC